MYSSHLLSLGVLVPLELRAILSLWAVHQLSSVALLWQAVKMMIV